MTNGSITTEQLIEKMDEAIDKYLEGLGTLSHEEEVGALQVLIQRATHRIVGLMAN